MNVSVNSIKSILVTIVNISSEHTNTMVNFYVRVIIAGYCSFFLSFFASILLFFILFPNSQSALISVLL